jgi:hypothetical protein
VSYTFASPRDRQLSSFDLHTGYPTPTTHWLSESVWDKQTPAEFDMHLFGQRFVVLFVYLSETYDLQEGQAVVGIEV